MNSGVVPKVAISEAKLFLRDPTTSLIALLLPIGLMVVFGAIGLGNPDQDAQESGITRAFLPGMVIAISVGMLTLSVLPTVLATYREKGILRRLRTTPVHPSVLLTGQLLVNVTAALVAIAGVVVLGGVAFDTGWPSNWPGFIVSVALFTAAMLSLGLVIAAVAKTTKQGTGLGMLLFFPSLFFAGIWTPGDSMPEWARPIRDWSPMGAGIEAVQTSWLGDWPDAQTFIALVLWIVVCGVIAARLFRWE